MERGFTASNRQRLVAHHGFCEDEGADIQAQPHDATDEGNDEPNLRRLEQSASWRRAIAA